MRVVDHGGKRLSEGLVTEATVKARVLGMRLITIDATILIAPAEVEPARPRPGRTGTRPPVGRDLAWATRFIDENEAALATERRRQPAHRRR